jgi:hypothetical protein
MRGSFSLRRLALLALAALPAAPLVGGCSTAPPHKDIEAIGVVASQDVSYSDSSTAYVLRSSPFSTSP